MPQDAFFFRGSLRFNFDPLREYSDSAIWDAIRTVGMKDAVCSATASGNHLDQALNDYDMHFSAGQQQVS